jgi:hypothetical protein
MPANQDRDEELVRLIASCESLRKECEHLFRRIADLLSEDRRSGQDGPSSFSDR